MLNKLLQSQIDEYSAQDTGKNIQDLFKAVSRTYDSFESDISKNSHIQNLQKLLKQEIEKRKSAEQQLKQQSEYFSICHRTANICTWELDLIPGDLTIASLTLSKEANEVFGYQFATDTTFNDLLQRIPSDDAPEVLEKLRASISSGENFDTEYRLTNSEKSLHCRGKVIVDTSTGNSLKIIGTIQEIKENKRLYEALENAHTELTTLFENMKEASFTVDVLASKTIQISKACEEIFGYTVQEFKDNHLLWLGIIIEEDKWVIYNNYPLLAAGSHITQEYRIRQKKGEIRWIESHIMPTLKDGVLVRIDGISSDITKRKEAEIALKESEYKFRTLLQNSDDVILVVDETSKIIFASDSSFQVMGYAPSEIIGSCSFDYIYPEDLHILEKNLKNVLQSPAKVHGLIYRRVRKDGRVIWCEGVSTNLLQDPAIKGIVINFKDITERIHHIDALKQTNRQLKKSNDELDRFVYSVSHDLRAPLSSILGAIEYSETETNDPEMLEILTMMKGSARKLDSFILDLLDYSKNARLDLHIEQIDLEELLGEIKSHLKYMGTSCTQVSIDIKINSDELFYSDRNRLTVILNNLISNGIRYCKSGINDAKVEVLVNIDSQLAAISVKDNGVGIDPKYHAKIFDMFYRVSTKSEGSGLGLYIVKDTIEKLNGSLHFHSELYQGTEFNLLIPNMYSEMITLESVNN